MYNEFARLYDLEFNKNPGVIAPIIASFKSLLVERKKTFLANSNGMFAKFFHSPEKDNQILKSIVNILETLESWDDSKRLFELAEFLNQQLALVKTDYPTIELINHIAKKIEAFDLSRSIHYLQKNMDEKKLIKRSVTPKKINVNIRKLLHEKGLALDLFSKKNNIDISSDIQHHVAWIYENIYQIPYSSNEVMRTHHGIQHVSRVAYYIPVLVNLYRRHNDHDALEINDSQVKLLQLAALFHDAGREGEGEDLWDDDSAVMLYYYLHHVLKIDTKSAIQFAEAIANKDERPDGYHSLKINRSGDIYWEIENFVQKNILQKVLHDADSLDIIRARLVFDGSYTDFYKDIAGHPSHKIAFDELALLITEVRSLIASQGDAFNAIKIKVKNKYQNVDCYGLLNKDAVRYHLLHSLNNGNHILSQVDLQSLRLIYLKIPASLDVASEEYMNYALLTGKLFTRSLGGPSGLVTRKDGTQENVTQIEIDKTQRREGIPTRKGNLTTHGNPLRSISMIGYGSAVFASSGFLIANPKIENIKHVSGEDHGSGRKTKKNLQKKIVSISEAEKKSQLDNIHAHLKLGGIATTFAVNFQSAHTEITATIDEFHAIYFCNEGNLFNKDSLKEYQSTHKYSPLLQAIFIQNQYELSRGINLPIFEYSPAHNHVKQMSFTSEKLLLMWKQMCGDFIRKQLNKPFSGIQILSIDDIKVLAMYTFSKNDYNDKYLPADIHYPLELQNEINDIIYEEKNKKIKKHADKLIKKLKNHKLTLDSIQIIDFINIQPEFISRIKLDIPFISNDSSYFGTETNVVLPTIITSQDILLYHYLKNESFSDDLLLQSQMYKDLYSVDVIRAYKSSKLFGFDTIKARIQNDMGYLLSQEIDLLRKITSIDHLLRIDFYNLVANMMIFDLQDICKLEIVTLIEETLKAASNIILHNIEQDNNTNNSTDSSVCIDILYYVNMLMRLNVLELLTDSQKITAHALVCDVYYHSNIKKYYGDMFNYINTKKLINPQFDTKTFLLDYIDSASNQEIIKNDHFFKRLNSNTYTYDLMMNDPQTYQSIIEHIDWRDESGVRKLTVFRRSVLYLHYRFDKFNINEDQISIIKHCIDEKIDDVINEIEKLNKNKLSTYCSEMIIFLDSPIGFLFPEKLFQSFKAFIATLNPASINRDELAGLIHLSKVLPKANIVDKFLSDHAAIIPREFPSAKK